jgi:hypothetical protein
MRLPLTSTIPRACVPQRAEVLSFCYVSTIARARLRQICWGEYPQIRTVPYSIVCMVASGILGSYAQPQTGFSHWALQLKSLRFSRSCWYWSFPWPLLSKLIKTSIRTIRTNSACTLAINDLMILNKVTLVFWFLAMSYKLSSLHTYLKTSFAWQFRYWHSSNLGRGPMVPTCGLVNVRRKW